MHSQLTCSHAEPVAALSPKLPQHSHHNSMPIQEKTANMRTLHTLCKTGHAASTKTACIKVNRSTTETSTAMPGSLLSSSCLPMIKSQLAHNLRLCYGKSTCDTTIVWSAVSNNLWKLMSNRLQHVRCELLLDFAPWHHTQYAHHIHDHTALVNSVSQQDQPHAQSVVVHTFI